MEPKRRKPNERRALTYRIKSRALNALLDGYEHGLTGATWRDVPYKNGCARWHAWLEGWRKGRYEWYLNGRR